MLDQRQIVNESCNRIWANLTATICQNSKYKIPDRESNLMPKPKIPTRVSCIFHHQNLLQAQVLNLRFLRPHTKWQKCFLKVLDERTIKLTFSKILPARCSHALKQRTRKRPQKSLSRASCLE